MTAPPPTPARREPSRRPPQRVVSRAPRLAPSDLAELFEVGQRAGLDLVGACRAAAWTSTRSRLEERKAAGLNATMAFTFKNPARSSDPTRVLKNASTLLVGARSYVQARADEESERAAFGTAVAAQVARYATADHYGELA
ncbi:MAG: hypothetical protein GX868_03060, partial [Actinobacteria bacterium]|nr:hypothetical protein [Actinomycetota bacterium]